ncbi:MAG: hypothetical protein R2873_19115 [Caldilineaceae bacterium]
MKQGSTLKHVRSWLLAICALCTLALGTVTWVAAQEGTPPALVESSRVSGTLDAPFDKDYLVLRVVGQRRPLTLVMDYVPQGRWELDDRMGFFVFDPLGFDAYLNRGIGGALSVASGVALPGTPRRLQATILQPNRDIFYIVVYNDSPLPMNYVLTAQNGLISDQIGGQIVDVYNPPLGDAGQAPLIVVPAPTASPTPTLPPRRLLSISDALTGRYDSNFHELRVLDRNVPVRLEMTYDPPEQFLQDKGLEFNVFTDHQLRVLLRDEILPWRAEDMTEGHLTIEPDGRYVWRAEIMDPYDQYTVVVSQYRYSLLWLGYRLTAENAVFLRPSEAPTVTPTPMVSGGGPFIVVEVEKRPTVTPIPTVTPFPTPTVESPLPTPTETP